MAVVNGAFKIGQLARQVGVTAKAIRFYEAKRVLPQPARGANGTVSMVTTPWRR
jgi:hypothetical protein